MITASLSYGRQWLNNEDIRAVTKTLRTDWITQGPTVSEFETAIARKVQSDYALAVSNGTAALHAACHAINIQPGDEVVIPTLTFTASANCVLFCGGTPILCDVNPDTLTVDANQIEQKITSKTRAIIAVDFAGHPAEWDKLKQLAKRYRLALIDDAAHSLGATFKNKPIGSVADLTIFSFHPVKLITTGEGGMVVTNNQKYADRIRAFRTHGIVKPPGHPGWYQEMVGLGYNYRLTDFQAALGLSQLKKSNTFLKKRRGIVRQYFKAFRNYPELILPPDNTNGGHAWHIFVLQFRTKNRNQIYDILKTKGIGTQVHYLPIHLHPYYQKKFGYRKGDFPNAEKYFSRCLTIPLFPAMNQEMINKVIREITRIVY